MINKNTIISSFDDRLTLLEWLKKVEYALNQSMVDSFSLHVVDGQLSASLLFADGETLDSNSVPLDAQQFTPITNNEIDILF